MALAVLLPKGAVRPRGPERRAVGVRYSEEAVCESASAWDDGVVGLSSPPSFHRGVGLPTVGVREEPDASRISAS